MLDKVVDDRPTLQRERWANVTESSPPLTIAMVSVLTLLLALSACDIVGLPRVMGRMVIQVIRLLPRLGSCQLYQLLCLAFEAQTPCCWSSRSMITVSMASPKQE
jgi:hypothetical protein